MMRLDKYLAERTGMTRSESRKAITKGRVMVAGKICRKADTQLDETAAQIALDGAPLAGEYKKYVYIMLNKPEGVGGSCPRRAAWIRPAPALYC